MSSRISTRFFFGLLFTASLTVVLGAMAWVSLAAIHADRAETDARRQAAFEGAIRLALWRMDTAMATLLAQENARPAAVYRPFLPASEGVGRMAGQIPSDGLVIPSPLLRTPSAFVLVHFQYGPDGRLTSPESPRGEDLARAVPRYLSEAEAAEMRKRLDDAAGSLALARLESLLPKQVAPPLKVASPASLSNAAQGSWNEYQRRGNAILQNNLAAAQLQGPFAPAGSSDAFDTSGVPLTPLWIDGRLLLARRFMAGQRQYVQGCILDWSVIRQSLLKTIADLLPAADLTPIADGVSDDQSRRLAALPICLVPGPVVHGPASAASPLILSLTLAWVCASLAVAAVAGLLLGIVRLSDRRAAFTSAVTHELRTPLTTFQMYAEMLAEDMVPDALQRRQYLETLRDEAIRLTHLVENVLAYARLERGRTMGRMETVAISELLEDVSERLVARAGQAGMTLAIEDVETGCDAMASANRSAVEQVLYNLVDNACKYAATATDRQIRLTPRLRGRWVEIAVADHGPGLSPNARRRLFRSFSKSAAEAAASAPGIGLGLALSRRLARDMGGDLRLEPGEGATFVLAILRVQTTGLDWQNHPASCITAPQGGFLQRARWTLFRRG
ncbi:MAG: HAMP domain-containing sensor histidine kinase [Thermoguttaceae bacterium]